MKKLLSLLCVLLVLSLVACSSVEISGTEIIGLEQMNENEIAEVLTTWEENSMMVYDIEGEDLIKLRDLFCESTYTREKDIEISDELKEKCYVIVYDLDNGEMLRIFVYAGEYIQVDNQFGGDYLAINNPDFESRFKEIVGIL